MESFTYLLNLLTEKLSAQEELNVESFRGHLQKFLQVPIPETSSISTIIDSIGEQKLWDYYNFSDIERIADRYIPKDKEVRSAIDGHIEMVNNYHATRSIADYIEERLVSEFRSLTVSRGRRRNSRDYYDTISLKLDDVRVGQKTLKYVRDLWKSLRRQFRIPECNALLDSIYSGSVVIVWLIPSSVSPEMKRPQPWSAIHFLQDTLISRMVLNNSYCIYDTKVS